MPLAILLANALRICSLALMLMMFSLLILMLATGYAIDDISPHCHITLMRHAITPPPLAPLLAGRHYASHYYAIADCAIDMIAIHR